MGRSSPRLMRFAVGGFITFQSDTTIDRLSFDEISKPIISTLADQNYIPSRDLDKIQLLIVVYWGTTFGSASLNGLPGAAKDMIDLADAKLLGFANDNVFGESFGDPSSMYNAILMQTHGEVISAIELNRYFVILLAVDFHTVRHHGKPKLLWGTRISSFGEAS